MALSPEDFVNDGPTIGWVNTSPAISPSFSSAVTPASCRMVRQASTHIRLRCHCPAPPPPAAAPGYPLRCGVFALSPSWCAPTECRPDCHRQRSLRVSTTCGVFALSPSCLRRTLAPFFSGFHRLAVDDGRAGVAWRPCGLHRALFQCRPLAPPWKMSQTNCMPVSSTPMPNPLERTISTFVCGPL